MAKQIVIAIGREYGSGGHVIGKILAEKLGIEYYDRNLLSKMDEELGLNLEDSEFNDEVVSKPIVTRHVRGMSNSFEENIADLEFEFLKNKAKEGKSFIIIGRCAEYILKDVKGMISIFVCADEEDKINRIMDRHNIDEKSARAKMLRHDTTRKKYHEQHTETEWGRANAYDVCINASRLGVEGTANALHEYVSRCIDK